ncbi:tRNA (adenosine(37)-N6)-dimethylallyltransferase MiaA [Pedobacter sp. SYSU D00535]|uniref:tRNA (adenosine(37)-N6)-dimethylallyltransferase MiaA n=1 Tax=Pedobacter sp. SYSU D00535 TaxID=2810308 RepID=UPI001A977FF8|nr:tRNA (adenosine(37)-N6)-dimethylallyltransferase MiaA [Pedobacter sp. SYSU D00535]
MSEKTLIVIVGPTAIGKTELAIKVAQEFNTEIISADSRQFYREMSIGTAKPTAEELAAAPHHFIDSLSITDTYTVGDYEVEALQRLGKLFERRSQAVLVGGSGLFIKAVTDGFDDLPKAPVLLREELNQAVELHGLQSLQERLKKLDPEYFNEVDLNNPQRVIRALEVCLSTGQPFSSFRQKNLKKRDFEIIKIGLTTDREKLYNRINLRVDKMMELGLLEEVKTLRPYENQNALNTVGYSELFAHLKGELSLTDAVASIKQNTRRFAKRQLTWFRRDAEITWFDPEDSQAILEFIREKAVG